MVEFDACRRGNDSAHCSSLVYTVQTIRALKITTLKFFLVILLSSCLLSFFASCCECTMSMLSKHMNQLHHQSQVVVLRPVSGSLFKVNPWDVWEKWGQVGKIGKSGLLFVLFEERWRAAGHLMNPKIRDGSTLKWCSKQFTEIHFSSECFSVPCSTFSVLFQPFSNSNIQHLQGIPAMTFGCSAI